MKRRLPLVNSIMQCLHASEPSLGHSCCLVQLTAAASVKVQRSGFQPPRLAVGLSSEPSAAPASSKAPAARPVKRRRLLPAPKLCSPDNQTDAVPATGTSPGCTSATSSEPVARAAPAEPASKVAGARAAPQLARAPSSHAGVASSSSAPDYEDALLAAETGPATPPAMKRTSGAGGTHSAQLLTSPCTSTEAMCRHACRCPNLQGTGRCFPHAPRGAAWGNGHRPGCHYLQPARGACQQPGLPAHAQGCRPHSRVCAHARCAELSLHLLPDHLCQWFCHSKQNCCAACLSRVQLAVASKCTQRCHIAGCSELCPELTDSIITLLRVRCKVHRPAASPNRPTKSSDQAAQAAVALPAGQVSP